MTSKCVPAYRMYISVALIACALCGVSHAGQINRVVIDWNHVKEVSQTTSTLQVAVNPLLRRGSVVASNAFKALHELAADYVRFIPWLSYPKLVVAELEPPTSTATSWDFSLIDPVVIDFFEATTGHPAVINFSTIPQWMWKTDKPVAYPADPNQLTFEYTQGTQPRDPSFIEISDYFARVLSWYTQGGFTDELGGRHVSGYHQSIRYWEVLNEIESEHQMSPETYTELYDSVVTAMRKVQPSLKFVGMALASPSQNPRFFEYFLDHKNHKPGIPLDCISYHFYAFGTRDETPEVHGYTFFAQADGFLNTVRYVEAIRKRLSPETCTMINEVGGFWNDGILTYSDKPIPSSHLYLTGALYAYLFGELTRLGIDVVGESWLLSTPHERVTEKSISMLDWDTGNPNSRFRVLQLLHDNFGPGDRIVATGEFYDPYIYVMAVITKDADKRVLLVNKSQYSKCIQLAGASGGQRAWVDQTTASNPPATGMVARDVITLSGYAVMVLTLP